MGACGSANGKGQHDSCCPGDGQGSVHTRPEYPERLTDQSWASNFRSKGKDLSGFWRRSGQGGTDAEVLRRKPVLRGSPQAWKRYSLPEGAVTKEENLLLLADSGEKVQNGSVTSEGAALGSFRPKWVLKKKYKKHSGRTKTANEKEQEVQSPNRMRETPSKKCFGDPQHRPHSFSSESTRNFTHQDRPCCATSEGAEKTQQPLLGANSERNIWYSLFPRRRRQVSTSSRPARSSSLSPGPSSRVSVSLEQRKRLGKSSYIAVHYEEYSRKQDQAKVKTDQVKLTTLAP